MPDIKRRADSLRAKLTGASTHDGSQSDPDASLGDHLSSNRVAGMGTSISNAISNLTVDYVSHANGEGDGTLDTPTVDTVTWTPPGGSAGAEVSIADGESKLVEGSDPNKFVIVSRTSTSDLSGTATVTLSWPLNNVVGLDNVGSSEASNGDKEYRCIGFENVNAQSVSLENVTVFLKTLGTQQTTDDGQLGSSGSGTISTTGSFGDWPDRGYARIEDSTGTLREIVYYSSRTSTSLTVPSDGRGLLGTTASAGASDDVVDAIPGFRVAAEIPGSQPSGSVQSVADEDTAPSVNWSTAITASGGISVGTLDSEHWFGVWVEREVPANAEADAEVLNKIRVEFDAL